VTPVEVIRGEGPLVLGMPHGGTWLPPGIAARLNANGALLADTDWHIDRLYEGLAPGATVVRATFHRYVVDANRDPSGASLYPGQNTTGLVPLTDFDGRPVWAEPPGEDEIAARVVAFHGPYHAALSAEMERVRARHGVAVLWDCHSIRSRIPFLFQGRLPDLNIGTDGGRTCAPVLQAFVTETCAMAEGCSHILNGRFKGGWTTRHYGRPEDGWHAIQMEIVQSAYLAAEAPPFAYDPARAAPLRDLLARLLGGVAALAPSLEMPR
jgi:formiminoglutamase